MFIELLDSQRYFFNPYSLPPLATAAGLLFVLVQFVVHGLQRTIRTPLILAFLAASIWLFAFHFMYSSKSEESALLWAKTAYLGVPFIAVATYDLAVRMRGLYASQKRFLWAAWTVSGFFALLAFDSGLIAHVRREWWGFYPLYGQAGLLFVGYFTAMATGSLWHFYRAYQGAKSASHRRMVQFIAFGLMAGYLAGVDFMAKLGASIYPFGYVCIFVSALLVFQGVAETIGEYGDALEEPTVPERAMLQQEYVRRLRRQQTALLSALEAVISDKSTPELIKELLEIIADGLELERIALWQYDGVGSMLQCRNIYRRPSRFHRVIAAQFIQPASVYLEALKAREWLTVENLGMDLRMRAFQSVYMDADATLATVEVPIQHKGQFLAVLSCQRAGEARQWQGDEREFVQCIVDLLGPLVDIPTATEHTAVRLTQMSPAVHAVMEELVRRDRIIADIGQKTTRQSTSA